MFEFLLLFFLFHSICWCSVFSAIAMIHVELITIAWLANIYEFYCISLILTRIKLQWENSLHTTIERKLFKRNEFENRKIEKSKKCEKMKNQRRRRLTKGKPVAIMCSSFFNWNLSYICYASLFFSLLLIILMSFFNSLRVIGEFWMCMCIRETKKKKTKSKKKSWFFTKILLQTQSVLDFLFSFRSVLRVYYFLF